MNIGQLKQMIEQSEISKCISLFQNNALVKNQSDDRTRLSPAKEYNPHTHLVTDKTHRPDKKKLDKDGNYAGMKIVSRIPLPLQKRIVQTAAAFLGTPTMEAVTVSEDHDKLIQVLKKVWDSNKLDYRFFNIAEITMSERHCAELWYLPKADEAYWDGYPITSDLKLSVKLLAESFGDELYPFFDEYGNMISFSRGYKLKDEGGRDIQYLDIFTDDFIYRTRQSGSEWEYANSQGEYSTGVIALPNPIKKIPVVYYWQPEVEWNDVQNVIDRIEKKISNHADTNDYFDSPIGLAKGVVESMPAGDDTGKLLQLENEGDFGYATWDTLPESMKMELERLYEDVFRFTSTPDISFDKMKGLGTFSGIAIKMFFVDAHLKAMRKSILFGEGLQRRINLLKAAVNVLSKSALKAALPLEIKPKFEFFMPSNDQETIQNLASLVDKGLISLETAVGINPYVTDAVEELKRINAEKEKAAADAQKIMDQKNKLNEDKAPELVAA